MERETGIEPATNSLEGCDSTTELLPPSRLARFPARRSGGQTRCAALFVNRLPLNPLLVLYREGDPPNQLSPSGANSQKRSPTLRRGASAACRQEGSATNRTALSGRGLRGWWGGEGSNLRSH